MVSKSHSSNQNSSGFDSDSNDMSQLLSLISQSIDNAGSFDNNSGDLQPPASIPSTSSGASTTAGNKQSLSATHDPQRGVQLAADQISDRAQSIEDKLSSLGAMLNSIKSEVVSLRHLVRTFEDAKDQTHVNGSMSHEFKSAITDTLAEVLNQSELCKSRKREDSGHCANCNRPAPFKCGRCNLVRYCSEFCQQRDWPIHNKICGAKYPTPGDLRTKESMNNPHSSAYSSTTHQQNNDSGESSSDSKDASDVVNGSNCDDQPNSPVVIKTEPIDIADDWWVVECKF